MNKIKTINLSAFSNGSFETYMKLIYGNAAADPAVSVKCSDVLTRYAFALRILDDTLVRSKKAPQSAEINLLSTRQLSLYRLFRTNVKRMREFRDAAVREAAGRLWQLTVDYNVTGNAKLFRVISVIYNLMQELEGKYAADVEKLCLQLIVSTLKETNARLYELVDERGVESSKRVDGEVAAARKDVGDAYTALVDQVNSLAYGEGASDYNAFIDFVNYNIVNCKRFDFRQPTKGAQATPEQPEGPQGPTVGDGEDEDKPGDGTLKPDPDEGTPNDPENPEGSEDSENSEGSDNNQGGSTGGGNTNPGGGYVPPSNGGGFD